LGSAVTHQNSLKKGLANLDLRNAT